MLNKFTVYFCMCMHTYMYMQISKRTLSFSFLLELKDVFKLLQITYSGAIIEVCMRKLVFYPEIVGFIEEEKDQFPTVKVQYLFNSPPKLIMLDDEGQHKETIRWAAFIMYYTFTPAWQ